MNIVSVLMAESGAVSQFKDCTDDCWVSFWKVCNYVFYIFNIDIKKSLLRERGKNGMNGQSILLSRLTEPPAVRKINGSYLLILKMLHFSVKGSGK